MLKIIKFTVSALLIFGIFSCDNTKSKIPTVHVEIDIPLGDPQYNKLQNLGGHINITGGYRGILVYHSVSDEYFAYDRACPYDPDCGKVFVKDADFKAVDTLCCKSEFDLLNNGIVAQGPAEYPLRAYRCTYNENTNVLYIRN